MTLNKHWCDTVLDMWQNTKYNKCVRLQESGEVLDCDSQFTILIPL